MSIDGYMRSRLFSEKSRSGRYRWLQVDEMPFSRAVTYKLIDSGLLSSVVVSWPGSKRGRRLIDGYSLDPYLEGLTEKQASTDMNRNDVEGRHNSAGKWLQEKRLSKIFSGD